MVGSKQVVIFLGDFIDRGPKQAQTIKIVQDMIENGHAQAVMGNHEFNAIAWATEDSQNPGAFLRARTQKNLRQHEAFLREVGADSRAHRKTIDWFKEIPNKAVPANLQPGYDGLKPLFIGHYWMSGQPELIHPHIACVDWSVAASDNPQAKLCAYQWDGETQLDAKNMLWVKR